MTATVTMKGGHGQTIEYVELPNGTCYHKETPEIVRMHIESARIQGRRIRIHLGDAATGQAWGDTEVGIIGRSTGRIRVPLVIPNVRSTGGPALLDHCIVLIEYAKGGVIWKHPGFQPKKT